MSDAFFYVYTEAVSDFRFIIIILLNQDRIYTPKITTIKYPQIVKAPA